MQDRYGRKIDYLRISITDRCNLRCRYCMPDGIEKVPMSRILTYEQILLIAEACTRIGITKFKVTGGEPLVRKGCIGFVRRLRSLPGVQQVTMTTNGILLAENAAALREAGLDAVNVSLDTADPERFRQITGGGELEKVLAGIRAAQDSRIPVKLNTVLLSGGDSEEWRDVLSLARDLSVDVRFIELMPIGFGRTLPGFSGEALLSELEREFPGMEPDTRVHGNGPARDYRIPGFPVSVGFISAIHGTFCASCNRIRLTSQGLLKPCLCYGDTVDLRPLLNRAAEDCSAGSAAAGKPAAGADAAFAESAAASGDGAEDLLTRLSGEISRAVLEKPAQHCFGRDGGVTEERGMSQIGG